jgi:hypothetical protein
LEGNFMLRRFTTKKNSDLELLFHLFFYPSLDAQFISEKEYIP